MFCSIYLMVSILLNIVQMGSTLVDPACNMRKKPSVSNFTASDFAGTWYRRSSTAVIQRFENLTAYIVEIDPSVNNGQTQLDITTNMSFSDRSNCISVNVSCVLQGPTCTLANRVHTFELLAIDYNNVFAMWSVIVHPDDTYKILDLYARNATGKLRVGSIGRRLNKFCGNDTADPNSSFYARKFYYNNSSPCIA